MFEFFIYLIMCHLKIFLGNFHFLKIKHSKHFVKSFIQTKIVSPNNCEKHNPQKSIKHF